MTMAHSHDDHSTHDHVWAPDLTKNQGLVLGALAHAEAPLSAYELLDKLRGDGLRAPLQVYRALDKLVERGLAHRLESLNAFVACADEQCHRKGLIAFAICDGCGKVDEFADAVIEDRLGHWAEAKGFKVERTTMEIRGKCGVCAAA
jgi:Fur family zinc uptake transcriptional regulator